MWGKYYFLQIKRKKNKFSPTPPFYNKWFVKQFWSHFHTCRWCRGWLECSCHPTQTVRMYYCYVYLSHLCTSCYIRWLKWVLNTCADHKNNHSYTSPIKTWESIEKCEVSQYGYILKTYPFQKARTFCVYAFSWWHKLGSYTTAQLMSHWTGCNVA